MRILLLFCALGALLGCKQVSEPSGTAIALFCSTSDDSKTESLTVGEEVAVFACLEGTEGYFLEAARFIVGSDGRSLTYGSTVYYPDPKQAVTFTAYLPFGGTWDGALGTFSVPTDQSKPEALKQADLCGAVASTTPVATPVALEFKHLMARLVITTNEPTTRIVFPNALASGVLHAATAQFVLGTARKDIWTESTTSKELIVPVQPLSRLILTVSNTVLGVVSKTEYVFDTAPIALEAGKTTTLNLTLHPATKTATLAGSSVTDWELVKTEGNPTHVVSNLLTLHWPSYVPQGATPDSIVFTINEANYGVAGIAYANKTFTVPFASSALRYPYTISKIAFYRGATPAQPVCTNLLGGVIYKSGASTVGIKDPANAIKIGDLWWATGNLVASKSVAGAHGLGGCRIGAPADGGLYFQFGSLIGYKGGALANGGSGVGSNPYTTNGVFWNGTAAFSWANEAMVWPTGMVGNPITWPQGATTNQWYFGLQAGWSTAGQNIRDYPNFATGGLADKGVGDPCTYYLGGTWRLPSGAEYAMMCNNQSTINLGYSWSAVGGSWIDTPVSGGNFYNNELFFPISGYRIAANGSFLVVLTHGFEWVSSIHNATNGLNLDFNNLTVFPQRNHGIRSYGFPVRCVSE